MSLLLHSYTDLQEVPVEAVPGLRSRPAAVSRRGGRAHGGGEVVALVVAFPRLTLTDTETVSSLSSLLSSRHDGLLAVRNTLPGLEAIFTHKTTK